MAKRLGFYRPHKRLTFSNLSLDPVTGEMTELPSMTKQEFQHECDINNVIKSFKPAQMLAMMQQNLNAGNYTDLPDSYDFQEALHLVKDAEKQFLTVPARVRDRFGQDPAQFLAFLNDPRNLDEARTLGLAHPAPAEPAPVLVQMAPTPKTGGDGGTPPS